MSFISYPQGAGAGASSARAGASEPTHLTTSGRLIRSRDNKHLMYMDCIGGRTVTLFASDPAELVIPITAQGKFLLHEIAAYDLQGTPGNAQVTIRTLDVARGGGRVLTTLPLSGLSDRKAAVRRYFNQTASFVFNVPHFYLVWGGSGSGTVNIRILGTVVSPEDPEHPLNDKRRYG